jgi:hypothetical protein
MMLLREVLQAVTPAEAGVQLSLLFLDSGFRRNDRRGQLPTFCEDQRISPSMMSPALRERVFRTCTGAMSSSLFLG